ncbi:High affinity copper uptake protein 1 [Nymphon striatum]|nr:High affinity copper uptake protein 1 [Nymphon striatum]
MQHHNHSAMNNMMMETTDLHAHHKNMPGMHVDSAMSNHSTDGMHGMTGMHGMKMYFHAGVTETILFECWKTHSAGTMVASFIGIFIIALLYEGLKFFREHLYRKHYTDVKFTSIAVTSSSADSGGEMQKVVTNKILSFPHLFQTFLHVLQLVISYFLMLIFMTFNVWLCLAVALGAGVGYFLFGWKKAIIVNVSEALSLVLKLILSNLIDMLFF